MSVDSVAAVLFLVFFGATNWLVGFWYGTRVRLRHRVMSTVLPPAEDVECARQLAVQRGWKDIEA